ncbi:MAG: hypothetical protein Tsb0026_05590 [Sulfuricaulis sp.]
MFLGSIVTTATSGGGMPPGGCEFAPSQPEIRIAASAGKIHPLVWTAKDGVEVLFLMLILSIHPAH